MKQLLAVLVLSALAACGVAPRQHATLVAQPLPQAPGVWMEFTPQPVEIDGRTISATCSDAPGGDPAFKFWARRGVSDRLVVFFDGGGACWDAETCAHARLADTPREDLRYYRGEITPDENPALQGGVFDFDNPRNPVRDWSFVFVPYCTGDVHSGANTAHYVDPETGAAFEIEHRGADNFRVVLEWMRANFASPDQILVTGSSAGAYGAATHFGRIRDAWPEGRAAMLGDAGQGVTAPGFIEERNENWGYDLPESVFGENARLTDDADVVATLMAHYPHDRFAQYTTTSDLTQIFFYGAMTGREMRAACGEWVGEMAQAVSRRGASENFRSYLAAGETHTILATSLFYSERSGGAPFAEWLAAMLAPDAEGWDNRVCRNCLRPPNACQQLTGAR